jgi:hypothetical protein
LNELTKSEKLGAYIEGCIKYGSLKKQKKTGRRFETCAPLEQIKINEL